MKLLSKITFVAVVSVGASMLHAAPDDPIGGKADGSASVTVGVDAKVSLTEMLVRAKSFQDQVEIDTRYVLHIQQLARKEKDVIKLNCINDKLVQIKPQANIVERAVQALQIATDETRAGVFEELRSSTEGIRRMKEEAERCAGEPILTSESSNGFTGPQVPDNPFNEVFNPPVEPPGYASPYF